MKHIIIFYLIFSFSIGIVALFLLTLISIITKSKDYLYYLFFILSMTLLFSIKLIYNYIDLNVVQNSNIIHDTFQYVLILSEFLVMLIIALMVNYLAEIKKNIYFFILIIIGFILYNIGIFLELDVLSKINNIIIDSLMIFFTIFAILILILFSKKIKSELHKKIITSLKIFLLTCLPLIIIDSIDYTSNKMPIPLHPIFYCGFSIIITYHLISYYVKIYQFPASITEDVIKYYNISNREKEIIELLIKGYSNNKLCDTLFISLNTTKTHLKNIYNKFDVKSRFELISKLNNHTKV